MTYTLFVSANSLFLQTNTPDKVGNIVSKVTGLGATTYGYDDIYQLTSADQPIQPDESFTYDGVGNRLTSTDYSDWDYNSRNQLTGYNGVTYVYDDNGNTTSKTDTGSTTTYTYNYENRLTRIDFPGGGYVTYKYDVKGRRIEKDVDGTVSKYLYAGDVLLAEYNGSGVLQRNYFYGSGDINPSVLYEGSTIYFYHHDHLNTPQAVTNESGTIVWDSTYTSFGEVNITTETVSNNFRFPGQYYDQESELHYNYHRYYDTSTGRYLREDPIHYINENSDFIPFLNYFLTDNPLTLHAYIYVENNPIKFTDSLGLLKNCYYGWDPQLHTYRLICPGEPGITPNCIKCNSEGFMQCLAQVADADHIGACSMVCKCPLNVCKVLCAACLLGKGGQAYDCFDEHCQQYEGFQECCEE